jgi:hypothetical protein
VENKFDFERLSLLLELFFNNSKHNVFFLEFISSLDIFSAINGNFSAKLAIGIGTPLSFYLFYSSYLNSVAPNSSRRADYLSLIATLPDNDKPSFFHLPENVNKIIQLFQSSYITARLNSMVNDDCLLSNLLITLT